MNGPSPIAGSEHAAPHAAPDDAGPERQGQQHGHGHTATSTQGITREEEPQADVGARAAADDAETPSQGSALMTRLAALEAAASGYNAASTISRVELEQNQASLELLVQAFDAQLAAKDAEIAEHRQATADAAQASREATSQLTAHQESCGAAAQAQDMLIKELKTERDKLRDLLTAAAKAQAEAANSSRKKEEEWESKLYEAQSSACDMLSKLAQHKQAEAALQSALRDSHTRLQHVMSAAQGQAAAHHKQAGHEQEAERHGVEQADAASAMVEHMEVETGEPEAEATATASRQHVAVLSREVAALKVRLEQQQLELNQMSSSRQQQREAWRQERAELEAKAQAAMEKATHAEEAKELSEAALARSRKEFAVLQQSNDDLSRANATLLQRVEAKEGRMLSPVPITSAEDLLSGQDAVETLFVSYATLAELVTQHRQMRSIVRELVEKSEKKEGAVRAEVEATFDQRLADMQTALLSATNSMGKAKAELDSCRQELEFTSADLQQRTARLRLAEDEATALRCALSYMGYGGASSSGGGSSSVSGADLATSSAMQAGAQQQHDEQVKGLMDKVEWLSKQLAQSQERVLGLEKERHEKIEKEASDGKRLQLLVDRAREARAHVLQLEADLREKTELLASRDNALDMAKKEAVQALAQVASAVRRSSELERRLEVSQGVLAEAQRRLQGAARGQLDVALRAVQVPVGSRTACSRRFSQAREGACRTARKGHVKAGWGSCLGQRRDLGKRLGDEGAINHCRHAMH